jgi:hypothetical protein
MSKAGNRTVGCDAGIFAEAGPDAPAASPCANPKPRRRTE